MPQESNLAFKVGSFVLIALIALTAFIFSVSDSSVFVKGDTYYMIFSYANGVKKSAPVRIAGVDQGSVRNLKLFFDENTQKAKVSIEVWLPKDIKISRDSEVLINQLGLMGEKYIEIIPGQNNGAFYKAGDEIYGSDPILQERLSRTIIEVADKAKQTISGFNRLINDQENIQSISGILKNVDEASGNMKYILQSIKDGEGTIGKFLKDGSFYADLEDLGADLKENPWKLLYRPKNIKTGEGRQTRHESLQDPHVVTNGLSILQPESGK